MSNMADPTDQQIVALMSEYGGSFARSLASTWVLADSSNRRIICEAFHLLWKKYNDLAMKIRCPNCGSIEVDKGHHDGTTCGVPECNYDLCLDCGNKWGMN